MRKRLRRTLLAGVALLAALTAVQVKEAPPAEAAITVSSCNPSSTGWDTKGAWDDGTVMEARSCFQYDNVAKMWRVRAEWRVRKGGTAISGTDWDLDWGTDNRGYESYISVNGSGKWGLADNFQDVFNSSIITKHSNWYCYSGAHDPFGHTYSGTGREVRATPPGLPKSGYKAQSTASRYDVLIECA